MNSLSQVASTVAFQKVPKRVALYARVSTQEQTKGLYPSCDSQIEELEAYCKSKGWQVFEPIKDEGHRAGTLKRPGLTRLRHLVETGQVDVVICTWYNRLIGSRDFYVLDKEFKSHNVAFLTVHDQADRNTASGRLLESMLVTIKTFENEQIGEKVRTKMRLRAEKGLWNGGLVPFGFTCDPKTQLLQPDEEKAQILNQIFQVYVDTASDFAVRDWLKAHQIPSPSSKSVWAPSTIHDMLTNRRYIAEIELNKPNKGLDDTDIPEMERYRIVQAPHEPLVSRELFEMAQLIRRDKALESPNRKGKPRSYSQNQCNRVYPLQGRLFCGVCGHAMTPYYVVHKPGPKRRNASYIYYYICANQMMNSRHAAGHSNRVLARIPESWIVERLEDLFQSETLIEQAVEMAKRKCESDFAPQQEALTRTRQALQENQAQIDKIVETITSSSISGELLGILSEKATQLKLEQGRLRAEQHRLSESIQPLEGYFDALPLRQMLGKFTDLAQEAEPEEMQRLLRAVVNRIEWMPDGKHVVELYYAPQKGQQKLCAATTNERLSPENQKSRHSAELYLDQWLESNLRNGCPGRIRTSDQSVNSRPLYH
jgi:site-specific DNA recombinase